MADGVQITAGSGTTILTDDTGAGGHAQVTKLAISTDGSGTLIPADAGNGLDVDVTRVQGNVTVVNAGTFPTQDSEKIADDSAFSVGASKVQPAGFLLDDSSTDVVDEGDIGIARMTPGRRQIVATGESPANLVRGGGSKTDTTDQALMTAGAAGVYNLLSWIAIHNASATDTFVNIKDGSTVIAVIPAPAKGGAVVNFDPPIRSSAATAINAASNASVTTMHLYGGGYQAR